MKIEVIENIDSELLLFIVNDKNVINIQNGEEERRNKKLSDLGNKKETIPSDGFPEGGVEQIFAEITRQKRNPKLREEAIRQYGYTCCVCGVNFESLYGDLGAGYIEVHHLQLLSSIKDERVVTVKDVAVVCANCHRVLHRNGAKPIPIEELKKIYEERKKLSSK